MSIREKLQQHQALKEKLEDTEALLFVSGISLVMGWRWLAGRASSGKAGERRFVL